MKTTIKKVDLAESVKNALATTKSAGMEAVETVFTEIAKALAEGNTVEISGFGKFEVTERSARTGINPATKEKIEIPASKSVKFKPSRKIMVPIRENLLSQSKYDLKVPVESCAKDMKYIVVHNTANDASAANEVAYT